MKDCQWESLIVIACNEANFPHVDTTDRPLVKRMKALIMRSLFKLAEEMEDAAGDGGEGDLHVFEMLGNGFKARLNRDARGAHMRLLVEAYRRCVADGGRVNEPAVVTEMVDKLLETADPRVIKAREFVEANVDFAPVRRSRATGTTRGSPRRSSWRGSGSGTSVRKPTTPSSAATSTSRHRTASARGRRCYEWSWRPRGAPWTRYVLPWPLGIRGRSSRSAKWRGFEGKSRFGGG
jgi:hypothetical protein